MIEQPINSRNGRGMWNAAPMQPSKYRKNFPEDPVDNKKSNY